MVKEVVLVFPCMVMDQKFEKPNVPLSIITLGTVLLEKGRKVTLIDQRTDPDWQRTLGQALERKPLMVGISCLSGPPIYFGLQIAAFVKERSQIPVVWGGLHPTLEPKTTIEHPLVDMLVVGDAEISIIELVQALEGDLPLSKVGGLIYKENGQIIINDYWAQIIPLSEIPPLKFDLVDCTQYKQRLYGFKEERTTVFIETTRGCCNRCAYCTRSKRPSRWRALNPEDTVGRFRYYKQNFGIEAFILADENFFVDLKRVEKIVELMEKEDLGIFWDGACRPEYLSKRISVDFLKRMEKVGFKSTVLGAESGSDRMLEFINKGCTSEDMILANRKLYQANIKPLYVSIVGFPTETVEDVRLTEKLVQTLADENPGASTTIVKLIPTPGSVILDECVKGGFPMPQKLEDWIKIFDPLFLTENTWIPKETMEYIKREEYYFQLLSKRNGYLIFGILYALFSKTHRLRNKYHFYKFPIESWAYELAKKILVRLYRYLP